VAWEVLNETDGDTQWVDSSFNLYSPNSFSPDISIPNQFELQDESTALAMKLQAEEDQKLAKMISQNEPYLHSPSQPSLGYDHPDMAGVYSPQPIPSPLTHSKPKKGKKPKPHVGNPTHQPPPLKLSESKGKPQGTSPDLQQHTSKTKTSEKEGECVLI